MKLFVTKIEKIEDKAKNSQTIVDSSKLESFVNENLKEDVTIIIASINEF